MDIQAKPTGQVPGSQGASSAAVPTGVRPDEVVQKTHPRICSAIAGLGLTARESQIVEGFATGKDTQKVAAQFYISTATVRTHLRKIFTTLDINSRVALLSLVLSRVLDEVEKNPPDEPNTLPVPRAPSTVRRWADSRDSGQPHAIPASHKPMGR